jgi:hypothetical protein
MNNLTSMNEQQRNAFRDIALLVHVVDVQRTMAVHLDVAGKLRELRVELCFMSLPVISMGPPLDKATYVRQRDAILPDRFGEFIREGGQFELSAE